MFREEEKTKGYSLYKLECAGLPSNTYVFTSPYSREILYNPQIAGLKLQLAMEKVGQVFVEIASRKAFAGESRGSVAELVLLAGGLYYGIGEGFRNVHNYAVPQCFLGIKRQKIEGSLGDFDAEVGYLNFEALPKDPCVIIGDTIATGTTLIEALNILEKRVEKEGSRLRKVVICSLAAATVGARKLAEFEKRMKRKDPKFELYLIVAEGLFHLMPDGTDMRFLREGSLLPDSTKEYTLEKYGPVLGEKMKCAVFDWGTRCKNPAEHAKEFMQFANEILEKGELDEKGIAEVKKMKKELEEETGKIEKRF